jgi:hypothetical protein
MSKIYDVRFTVTIPDGIEATEEEVTKWIRFELHEVAQLNHSPVSDLDMQADFGSVSVDAAW